jgi:hypothetical protein
MTAITANRGVNKTFTFGVYSNNSFAAADGTSYQCNYTFVFQNKDHTSNFTIGDVEVEAFMPASQHGSFSKGELSTAT